MGKYSLSDSSQSVHESDVTVTSMKETGAEVGKDNKAFSEQKGGGSGKKMSAMEERRARRERGEIVGARQMVSSVI